MALKVLHAGDFHLDSAFAALSPEQAKLRRRELRELPQRICRYAAQQGADVVLLAGDLFDGEEVYRDTLEELIEALAAVPARVFIAPGNHDYYHERSPYATMTWPDNVHIYNSSRIERVELPELHCAVYGAAFTAPSQETGLLTGFAAPDDGLTHLMVLHGDRTAVEARYNPVTQEEVAASGLDYLALGHTHSHTGFERFGRTSCAYSGCPEGRGFDETGDKGVLFGTVAPGECVMRFVPLARRRYEILSLDVSEEGAEAALRSALTPERAEDLLRVIFTGETDEQGIDLAVLTERFAPFCFSLALRDETRVRRDVWARAGEDSLRGLFLQKMRERYDAADEAERGRIERAVRFGLAALDHRDL